MENIWLTEEKKKEMEKEGNFVEGKYILFWRRRKTEKEKRTIFGEGKYLEKENIWRGKIVKGGKYLVSGGKEEQRR